MSPLFRRLVLAACLGGCGVVLAEDARPGKVTLDPEHAAKMEAGLKVFEGSVRQLLVTRCLDCHGGKQEESAFNLATREGLLKGGERGPAVVPGRGDGSLLYKLAAKLQEPHMPEDGEAFSKQELAALQKWIDLGAPYDKPLVEGKLATDDWRTRTVAPELRDFWSFRPLQPVAPPDLQNGIWGDSAVDRFILAAQEQAGLTPNPEASRAELVRRLYFDLLGLPPTPEQVASFVNDPAPDAYEQLVDRLLADPHYGERWGRRWLDLARFGESHGFEHDYDRPTAFHYRDFVIEAFNSGMPFDQFVRWQIAGDEFAPQDRLAQMATGFLAAGVHSTQITKNEVEKHRYDEMDDMLSTIGTSLLGLTVGCARCHDHKFDPIPQADYYRLLSAFTTTIRSEVDLDFDPEWYGKAKTEYDREHAPLTVAVEAYERDVLPGKYLEWKAAGSNLSQLAAGWWAPKIETLESSGKANFEPQPDGSYLLAGANPDHDTWTVRFTTHRPQLQAIRIEALAHSSLKRGGPGRADNGNFALTNLQVAIRPVGKANAPTQPVKLTVARATFEQNGLPVAAAIDDNTGSAWAVDPEFGKDHAGVFVAAEPFGFEGGTEVTLTLTFQNNVHHAIGHPRFSFSEQPDLPATTGPAFGDRLYDLLTKPTDSLTDAERIEVLAWFRTLDSGWKQLDDARAAHAATEPKPRLQKVLIATEGLPAVKLHTQAEKEFLPTTHFLKRGDPNNKDGEAHLGFLQVLMPGPAAAERWREAPPEGWRTSYQRRALANWLLDPQDGAGNLLARVIVNRLWQHHLGRGIVATPSDFGTRGEPPTHPELLDWLAGELLRHNWDLRPIHREILNSAVYRQTGVTDDARLAKDRENRWLWHRPRHRLEAEVIRDATLAISGQLDDRLYGPGTLDEGHRRRSIYFMIKRSHLIPMMTVFDAPDGTSSIADRPQTTIAPQALLLMNNSQVRLAARALADRVAAESEQNSTSLVRHAFRVAVQREPSAGESADLSAFLDQQAISHGRGDRAAGLNVALADLCQVLFCLNEFVYVD